MKDVLSRRAAVWADPIVVRKDHDIFLQVAAIVCGINEVSNYTDSAGPIWSYLLRTVP